MYVCQKPAVGVHDFRLRVDLLIRLYNHLLSHSSSSSQLQYESPGYNPHLNPSITETSVFFSTPILRKLKSELYTFKTYFYTKKNGTLPNPSGGLRLYREQPHLLKFLDHFGSRLLLTSVSLVLPARSINFSVGSFNHLSTSNSTGFLSDWS